MCRLMAYMGPPVLVADVVLWPDRLVLPMSFQLVSKNGKGLQLSRLEYSPYIAYVVENCHLG